MISKIILWKFYTNIQFDELAHISQSSVKSFLLTLFFWGGGGISLICWLNCVTLTLEKKSNSELVLKMLMDKSLLTFQMRASRFKIVERHCSNVVSWGKYNTEGVVSMCHGFAKLFNFLWMITLFSKVITSWSLIVNTQF